jgi:hypothetical protein
MTQVQVNRNYPIQVWLTSLILGPILLSIIFFCTKGKMGLEILSFLFSASIFGVGLSLPSYFLYRLAFKDFLFHSISTTVFKILLSSIATILMSMTFILLNYLVTGKANLLKLDGLFWIVLAVYTASIFVSGFYYNLKIVKP